MHNHILNEPDKNLEQQYMEIASRILKGYGLNPEQVIARHINKVERVAKRSKKLESGLSL